MHLLSGVLREIQNCSSIARLFPELVPKPAEESGYESQKGLMEMGKGRKAIGGVSHYGAQLQSQHTNLYLPVCPLFLRLIPGKLEETTVSPSAPLLSPLTTCVTRCIVNF